MLFAIYEALRTDPAWARILNPLRYPTFRIAAAVVASVAVCMVVGPSIIRLLRRLQDGSSSVRAYTPDTHLAKRGTPTMGGVIILLGITVGTLLFADLKSRVVLAALLLTLGFGLIGFLDDYRKLAQKNSQGLPGRWKLALQTAVFLVAVFGLLCSWDGGLKLLVDTRITVPFVPTHRLNPDLGWWYVLFGWVVVVGTSNAVNLTDGLDGLAIAPAMISALVFTVLCYAAGTSLAIVGFDVVGGVRQMVAVPVHEYLGIAPVVGGAELAVFCVSIVGAGIGFLWFNAYPASVFMGDVGALALGGALGVIAMLSKNELLSAIIHGVYLAEILSVIIQVTSFRLLGRRVFLMAPLHHHFEKAGMSETKIVIRFWIVSVLLGGVALAALKLR